MSDSRDGPGGVSPDHAPHPKELRPMCVPGTAGSRENLEMPRQRLGWLPAVRGAVQQGQC